MGLKFIDLFCGIGGIRLALESLGCQCVFSSEIEKNALTTYETNFHELPNGDITSSETKNRIPRHDILCAGFPCQAFSIAGKRKGFGDIRGTLFFHVVDIIKHNMPKYILLENVKGLVNHDRGKTLSVMLDVLRNDLNYFVPVPNILNSKDFGVPQNRERVFIVGFKQKDDMNDFEPPAGTGQKVAFRDVKEEKAVSAKYYLSTQYIRTLKQHKERHMKKGNGFGYEIIPDDGIANAIVVGGMGKERNLVYDHRLEDFTPVTHIVGEVNREGIRKMTPREWARLQGFPEEYKIPVSDSASYKLFGNSVTVPVVKAVARNMLGI